MRRLGVRARWAVPAGVVAGVGIIIAATAVATAEAAPSLPPRTAEQLLTEAAQGAGKPLGPFTATVQETANLGLPQLPAITQQPGESPALAAGTQSVTIWYGGPQRLRLAEPTSGGESDLRLDGRTLWLWDSKTQTATKYVLPAQSGGLKYQPGSKPGSTQGSKAGGGLTGGSIPATPQAAARQILAAVGPTTVVSVERNVYVAGQAAYQLSLVPRSSKSLVGQVLIAIDASRHIPLRLEVFPRGSSSVAYSIGYTSLTFGAPAAANFSFTPPPGATVHTQTLPASLKAGLGSASIGSLAGLGSHGLGPGGLGLGALGALASPDFPMVGQAFSPIPVAPPQSRVKLKAMPNHGSSKYGALAKAAKRAMANGFSSGSAGQVRLRPQLSKAAIKKIEAQFARSLPKSLTATQRARRIAAFDKRITAKANGRPSGWVGHAPTQALPAAAAGAPKTIGTSWLTVVATPPNPAVAATVRQALTGSARQPAAAPSASGGYSSSSSSLGASNNTITSTSGGTITSTSGGTITSTGSGASTVIGTSSAQLVAVAAQPGPDVAVLRALLKAATPVSGSWGSGRLLQTRLLTVLVTSKGQILAGAVTPAVLYADVALDGS